MEENELSSGGGARVGTQTPPTTLSPEVGGTPQFGAGAPAGYQIGTEGGVGATPLRWAAAIDGPEGDPPAYHAHVPARGGGLAGLAHTQQRLFDRHPAFRLRQNDSHTVGPFVGTVPEPIIAFPAAPQIVLREPVLREAVPLLVLSRGGMLGISDVRRR